MMKKDVDDERRRFLRLLGPIHDRARLTARRLCRSPADGDDLFQDAMLRALEQLPTLRDETRFRSWFYAVLLSVHRARSRRVFWRRWFSLDELITGGEEPAGEDGGRWEEARVEAARMARALAGLPAVQREAVVLFEVEGFSIEEVANLQGASVVAVKTRLVRARERLRRHYQALEEEGERGGGRIGAGAGRPAQVALATPPESGLGAPRKEKEGL
ncbi:MAG TPA: RNA polymerase sigma factor [Polyangia bacterium]|jgi:RNA polymerase sigma-70 factor (ECF subfamily)|nr:RNA polymerase sigma factor [Polyangia bacterium]